MNRRHFCKSAVNLGIFSAASSLFSWPVLSWAQNNDTPQFMVFIAINGGWDTSLSLDPWTAAVRPSEKDFFIEYRTDELLPFGNSFVGPAMKPLQPFFANMTVVNGMFVTANDGGHDSASIYMSTGNGQGHLGVLPLELEGLVYSSPFGTLANTSVFNGGKNKNIWDLVNLANSSLTGADALIDFGDKETEFSKARRALISHSDKINRYNEIFKSFSDNKEIAAIVSAFRSGLSQTSFLSVNKGLDTHAGHPGTHANLLTESFSEVAKVIAALKSNPGVSADLRDDTTRTLLDQTTVVVTSEFTRTPALNGSQGKDHNPQCNSALIFSPKMKSTIIGGSTLVTRSQSKSGTPYLAGLPLNNNTLMPSLERKDSFILRPENLMATVATSLGVNPGAISQDLAKAQILTNVLK